MVQLRDIKALVTPLTARTKLDDLSAVLDRVNKSPSVVLKVITSLPVSCKLLKCVSTALTETQVLRTAVNRVQEHCKGLVGGASLSDFSRVVGLDSELGDAKLRTHLQANHGALLETLGDAIAAQLGDLSELASSIIPKLSQLEFTRYKLSGDNVEGLVQRLQARAQMSEYVWRLSISQFVPLCCISHLPWKKKRRLVRPHKK